ncbi:MAG TPA: chorismate mutase [Gaiellaceae bacterium]|nr:chorismate mutase [Gaiellaceae bacterium]
MTDALSDARAEIDRLDRELLGVVNRRLEIVRGLHEHKLANDLPLRDPGREESMVGELQAANGGPLSAEGVADLFHHVLDLIRREIHGSE